MNRQHTHTRRNNPSYSIWSLGNGLRHMIVDENKKPISGHSYTTLAAAVAALEALTGARVVEVAPIPVQAPAPAPTPEPETRQVSSYPSAEPWPGYSGHGRGGFGSAGGWGPGGGRGGWGNTRGNPAYSIWSLSNGLRHMIVGSNKKPLPGHSYTTLAAAQAALNALSGGGPDAVAVRAAAAARAPVTARSAMTAAPVQVRAPAPRPTPTPAPQRVALPAHQARDSGNPLSALRHALESGEIYLTNEMSRRDSESTRDDDFSIHANRYRLARDEQGSKTLPYYLTFIEYNLDAMGYINFALLTDERNEPIAAVDARLRDRKSYQKILAALATGEHAIGTMKPRGMTLSAQGQKDLAQEVSRWVSSSERFFERDEDDYEDDDEDFDIEDI